MNIWQIIAYILLGFAALMNISDDKSRAFVRVGATVYLGIIAICVALA